MNPYFSFAGVPVARQQAVPVGEHVAEPDQLVAEPVGRVVVVVQVDLHLAEPGPAQLGQGVEVLGLVLLLGVEERVPRAAGRRRRGSGRTAWGTPRPTGRRGRRPAPGRPGRASARSGRLRTTAGGSARPAGAAGGGRGGAGSPAATGQGPASGLPDGPPPPEAGRPQPDGQRDQHAASGNGAEQSRRVSVRPGRGLADGRPDSMAPGEHSSRGGRREHLRPGRTAASGVRGRHHLCRCATPPCSPRN